MQEIKMNLCVQTPPSAMPNQRILVSDVSKLSVTFHRSLMRAEASLMSNNAARLFALNEFADALVLYKKSLALLNEMATSLPIEDCRMSSNTLHALGEINDFAATIEIPLDSELNQMAPSWCEEFASVAVMYNLFLLLRKTGQTKDALRFLELVHGVVEAGPCANKWHPTFRMSILYHLGCISNDCGKTDESLSILIQAIELGKKYIPTHRLFASVCSRLGHILVENGYYEEARTVFREATAIYERYSIFQVDPDEVPSEAFAAAAA